MENFVKSRPFNNEIFRAFRRTIIFFFHLEPLFSLNYNENRKMNAETGSVWRWKFPPICRTVLTLIFFYPHVMQNFFGFPDPEPIFLLKVATI